MMPPGSGNKIASPRGGSDYQFVIDTSSSRTMEVASVFPAINPNTPPGYSGNGFAGVTTDTSPEVNG